MLTSLFAPVHAISRRSVDKSRAAACRGFSTNRSLPGDDVLEAKHAVATWAWPARLNIPGEEPPYSRRSVFGLRKWWWNSSY